MEIPQIAFIHLVAGTITVLAGAIAMMSQKGKFLHRFVGNLYLGCMIALSLSGLYLSFTRSIVFTVFLSILALYLVVTGWLAAKRKDGATGGLEKVAMFAIAISALACAISGFMTPVVLASPEDVPPAIAYYVLAGLAAFFGFLDYKVIKSSGVSGKRRIARHLWRMCLSMFLATTIFFVGNGNLLPELFHNPYILTAPTLAVVVITVFWICRVLLTDWWGNIQDNGNSNL